MKTKKKSLKNKKKYSKKGGYENVKFRNLIEYNKKVAKFREGKRNFRVKDPDEPGECNWNLNPVGKEIIYKNRLTFDKNYPLITNVKDTIKGSKLVKKKSAS